MFDQEALNKIRNHPMLFPVLAVISGLLFILVILKFLVGSRTVKQVIDHESRGKSLSGKRRKNKKQKSQEKKSTDSPKPEKDDNIASLSETDARSGQELKNDKRKDGRSKTKSKKKRNVMKSEILPQQLYDDQKDEISDGIWQTVSTKEQREQQKREKKKQDEEDAAAANMSESVMVTKPEKNDPLSALFRPPGNISAIAKGIAPRFARAAGEQWQEKASPASNLSNPSKRNLPAAGNAAKQTSKILSANNSTVNQGWMSAPQGKQIWPAEKNRPGQPTWQTSTQSNNPRTMNSDLMGMSWTATDSSSLLTMVASGMSGGGPGAMPGWGQHGSTWHIPGNGVTNPSWENGTEEWVHIQKGTQNGAMKPNGENWTNCDPSQLQRPLGKKKQEEWTLEPEGFSAHLPSDPNDPWNIESSEPVDNDDWSAPVSTWDNTNDEWVAPEIVKPDPTYIDVSSDEDKDSKPLSWSTTSHQQQASTTQNVVGAGPDLYTQGVIMGGKKSRRRKKKKQSMTGESEQMTSSVDLKPVTSDKEQPTPDSPLKNQAIVEKEMITSMPDNTVSIPETGKQNESLKEQTQEDWSVPKVAKKKKSKVRKAD